jgi:hypothetical protein
MTQTITPQRYRSSTGQDVEVVVVEEQDTLVTLRDSEWTDGHLKLMSFPTLPALAYVGSEPPLMMTGTILAVGQALVKGPGGDFEVLPRESLDASHELLGGRHVA